MSTPTWREWWHRRGEAELRLILWAAWDPIERVPLDEYDRYAPPVAARLRAGASEGELAAFLGELRTGPIGLAEDRRADLAAAEKLHDWYHRPWQTEVRPADLE